MLLEVMGRLTLLFLAMLVIHILWTSDVASLKTKNPKETAFMHRRDKEAIARGHKPRRLYIWTPYDSISPYLRQAVVLAEDDTFYQHYGVEPIEVQRALQKNLEEKRFASGG